MLRQINFSNAKTLKFVWAFAVSVGHWVEKIYEIFNTFENCQGLIELEKLFINKYSYHKHTEHESKCEENFLSLILRGK